MPAANITTTTYSELKAFVTGAANAPDLAPAFNSAKWVIVAQQAISPAAPESDAAQLLIDQRADLLNGKRLIGFMFGPPYGFTTQQIERFTALYALYGKLAPNIDAAVQALDAQTLPGHSPVSIPALGYDLTVQTEPDPAQTIPLMVGEAIVPGQPTPAPVLLRVGDKAVIRAGPILDRNGHPVPDNTPVQFSFQYDGDPGSQDSRGHDAGWHGAHRVCAGQSRTLAHSRQQRAGPGLDGAGDYDRRERRRDSGNRRADADCRLPTRVPYAHPDAHDRRQLPRRRRCLDRWRPSSLISRRTRNGAS